MKTDSADLPTGTTPVWLFLSCLALLAYFWRALAAAALTDKQSVSLFEVALVLFQGSLPFCVGAIFIAVAVAGPRGAWAGVRYLFGRAGESELSLAANALGAAGTLVLHGGVCVGFLGLLFWLDTVSGLIGGGMHGMSADEWRGMLSLHHHLARKAVLLGPLLGILVGRFLLGVPAESAAMKAGVPIPVLPLAPQLCALAIFPIWIVLLTAKFQPLVS